VSTIIRLKAARKKENEMRTPGASTGSKKIIKKQSNLAEAASNAIPLPLAVGDGDLRLTQCSFGRVPKSVRPEQVIQWYF